MKNSIAFKGVAPPYKNNIGFKVIPIAKNPTKQDIKEALIATRTQAPNVGMNGRAYFYGEDLVVKKYKKQHEALNYNPNREIHALDYLYEQEISSPQIQKGEFALITPSDDVYLVSTRIEGKKIDPCQNKFNADNLASIVDVIGKLDTPTRNSFGVFPYSVSMHYDLSDGNINFNQKKGGIFDFEYLEAVDLSPIYEEMQSNFVQNAWCDMSDVPGVVSNLRNFEYRTLMPYLKKLNPEDARELFKEYLKIKSQYHFNRADFYYNELSNPKNGHETRRILKDLSKKELAHARCLCDINSSEFGEDIIMAEAMKIQVAGFIYHQSPFAGSEHKINPEQIESYVRSMRHFFDDMAHMVKPDSCYEEYFKNCQTLMQTWENVVGWMRSQSFSPDGYYRNCQDESILEEYESRKQIYQKFTSKIVKEPILTLEQFTQRPFLC